MAIIGYVEETDFEDYATARGILLIDETSVLLTKALDWLELQPFKGDKTDPEQILEFPRDGSSEIPDKIKTAQMVAALLYDSGEDLLGVIGAKVLREKVDVLEVQYSDKSSPFKQYQHLSLLLKDYLIQPSGTFNFNVIKV